MNANNIFNDYSEFYDLFYSDKDYSAECDFIEALLAGENCNEVTSILELGCGTGGHALQLAERRYEVTGIDLSEKMLKYAKTKTSKKKLDIRFINTDIRKFSLGQKFDAVIAMFDVISYLNSNQDVSYTFQCVKKHLNPNGVFIFDVWFGPGVITDLPAYREKTTSVDGILIKRIAEPTIDLMKQIVDVKYSIYKNDTKIVCENHFMRFFFPQEIQLLAEYSGMEIVKVTSFRKKDSAPNLSTWKATCMLCNKKE